MLWDDVPFSAGMESTLLLRVTIATVGSEVGTLDLKGRPWRPINRVDSPNFRLALLGCRLQGSPITGISYLIQAPKNVKL